MRKTRKTTAEKAPITSWPNRARRYTADRYFASRITQPLIVAFLAELRLGGDLLKLTPEEWEARYQEFLAAPR